MRDATLSAVLRDWNGSTRITRMFSDFILAMTLARCGGEGGMPGLGSRNVSDRRPNRFAKYFQVLWYVTSWAPSCGASRSLQAAIRRSSRSWKPARLSR